MRYNKTRCRKDAQIVAKDPNVFWTYNVCLGCLKAWQKAGEMEQAVGFLREEGRCECTWESCTHTER